MTQKFVVLNTSFKNPEPDFRIQLYNILMTAEITMVITTNRVIVSIVSVSMMKFAKNATGTVVSPSMLKGTRNINIPMIDGIKNFRNVINLDIKNPLFYSNF